jgi:WS/DGAT/MGAT family acyltransferase
MKHLNLMDTAMLMLESPETTMHAGGVMLFELPKDYDGDFFERFRRQFAERMHLAHLFSRKISFFPYGLANPVWVPVDRVDLDYHIRNTRLPKPGTMEQLWALVGRLHTPMMDRSRPLWEMHIIEGLETGQVAVYQKLHHAGVDALSGLEVMKVMFDSTPEPRNVDSPRRMRRQREPEPSSVALLSGALREAARQYVKLAAALPSLAVAKIKSRTGRGSETTEKAQSSLWTKMQRAPRTPFNVVISGERHVATLTVPFAQAREIGKRIGVTFNDVVLGIISGALRSFLEEHGGIPDKPLINASPVSARGAGDVELASKFSMRSSSLATNISDPIERLLAIHKATAAEKAKLLASVKPKVEKAESEVPAESERGYGIPWLLRGFVAPLLHSPAVMKFLPPIVNVVTSNVPGSPTPQYCAGAKQVAVYPFTLVMHGSALTITIMSYNNELHFGIICGGSEVAEHLPALAGHIRDAFVELVGAAAKIEPAAQAQLAAPAAAPRPRRTARKNTSKAEKLPV